MAVTSTTHHAVTKPTPVKAPTVHTKPASQTTSLTSKKQHDLSGKSGHLVNKLV